MNDLIDKLQGEQPLVSFLVAAHNEESYISECLCSLLGQVNANVEICVVDDGSTDSTWEILQGFKSEQVKIHRFPANRGKVAAFNAAFEMSRGCYVAIMGADDVAVSNRVELSLAEISGYEMVCGNLSKFDSTGCITSDVMGDEYEVSADSEFTFGQLLYRPMVFGGTILATREAMSRAFPLDPQLTHEDWWIPLCCAARRPVKYLHRVLVNYRIHARQSTGAAGGRRSIAFSRWRQLVSRETRYFELIGRSFPITLHEAEFVQRELARIRFFNLSLLGRLRFAFSLLLRHRRVMLNSKLAFIAILGPIGGYIVFRVKQIGR